MTESSLRNRRILYGRRTGHKLTPLRRALLAERLPEISLALGDLARPASLFKTMIDDLWLEVGFGSGEHLLAQAIAHPGIGIIGCEPFLSGVAKLIDALDENKITNVRLHADDARDVIDALPDASLGRVFVLFPDPWPKTRHWKRRIINPDNLAVLARVMKPGGELRLASDQPDYIQWTKEQIALNTSFSLFAEHTARPADWPETRYEQKARKAGRRSTYLVLSRRSG